MYEGVLSTTLSWKDRAQEQVAMLPAINHNTNSTLHNKQSKHYCACVKRWNSNCISMKHMWNNNTPHMTVVKIIIIIYTHG